MNETQPLPTAYRFHTEAKARTEMAKWADALAPAEGSEWGEAHMVKLAGFTGWWVLDTEAYGQLCDADPHGVIELAGYDECVGDSLATGYLPPAEAAADFAPVIEEVRRRAEAITSRWEREEAEAQAALATWEAGGEWVEAA